jgi:hypothetical protein
MMNRSPISRVVSGTIAVMLVVVVSRGVSLSAQGKSPFDEILEKLDGIIEMLTPQEGPVTLSSSTVQVIIGQGVSCSIANLGTEDIDGSQRQIAEDGGEIYNFPLHVKPGHSGGVGRVAESGETSARCEFTFRGTAASVRAHLQVSQEGKGLTAIVEMR